MDSTTSTPAVGAVAPASIGFVASRTDYAKATAKTAASKQTSTSSSEEGAPPRDSRSMQFQVEGDRVVMTIIDENNKTVVVQIPDAEVIRIAKAIDRMQGFLLEEKA